MVAGFPKIVRIVNEEGFAFLDASFLLRCESGCKLWGFSKKLFGSFSGFSGRPGNESAVKWVEMGWNAKSGILVVGGFKLRIMGEDLKFSNHGRSEDLNFKSGQSGQHKNCRHKEKEDLLISFNCTLGKCSKKNALHQIFLEGIYADSYILSPWYSTVLPDSHFYILWRGS